MIENGIGERLVSMHKQLRETCEPLSRIAVALCDDETDSLHTFVDSTDGKSPLDHYRTPLAEVPSLRILADSGENRIIDKLDALADSTKEHTRKILGAGYKSSFTVSINVRSRFLGFIFFDSGSEAFFTKAMQAHLSIYAQLISALITNDVTPIRTLKGAVKTAREFSEFRDEETAAHLSRMAHYTRLIALELSAEHGLNDERVEYIVQFAPLHDVGKVAIPDRILLKGGPLDRQEREIMRSHVTKGVQMVDIMINEFDLDDLPHINLLRNIIACHHESYDGSGYPHGLKGDSIPLEGRIIKTADVFDALTSRRPYKVAWSFDDARAYMRANVGKRFDPQCVQAIENNWQEMAEIQNQFEEEIAF